MAKTLPIYIDQGATWTLGLTLSNWSEDLDGYSARMQIRDSAQSSTIIAEPTGTITSTSDKTIQFELTEEETAAISATGDTYSDVTEYYYDVKLEDSAGTVWRLFNGPCYVSPEVTK